MASSTWTSLPPSGCFRDLLFQSLTLRFFLVYDLRPEERREALESVDALLKADQLVHPIGARFPLEEIAAAHECVEGGKVIGNTVIELA
jgi:NADPH2:quinone reductase